MLPVFNSVQGSEQAKEGYKREGQLKKPSPKVSKAVVTCKVTNQQRKKEASM